MTEFEKITTFHAGHVLFKKTDDDRIFVTDTDGKMFHDANWLDFTRPLKPLAPMIVPLSMGFLGEVSDGHFETVYLPDIIWLLHRWVEHGGQVPDELRVVAYAQGLLLVAKAATSLVDGYRQDVEYFSALVESLDDALGNVAGEL
jgi:hypothetical protein